MFNHTRNTSAISVKSKLILQQVAKLLRMMKLMKTTGKKIQETSESGTMGLKVMLVRSTRLLTGCEGRMFPLIST